MYVAGMRARVRLLTLVSQVQEAYPQMMAAWYEGHNFIKCPRARCREAYPTLLDMAWHLQLHDYKRCVLILCSPGHHGHSIDSLFSYAPLAGTSTRTDGPRRRRPSARPRTGTPSSRSTCQGTTRASR